MATCEHQTRFNDSKLPGRKKVCGREDAGVFETTDCLAPVTVALCRTHLKLELSRGLKFRTILAIPERDKRHKAKPRPRTEVTTQ